MRLPFGQNKRQYMNAEEHATGGWYPDPYGHAARRWFEPKEGWTDRVEGEGEQPDKTGLARCDDAAITEPGTERPLDEHGEPEPLSRQVTALDLSSK